MRMRRELGTRMGMGMQIGLVFNLAAHSNLGFNFNLSLDLDLDILTTTHIATTPPFKDDMSSSLQNRCHRLVTIKIHQA
ncbi:unnamed protein product [Brugia pahangi]|uniref:Secreted protein n=2 Tax=Brugia TaxID=6278 RepID=A0A0N4T779_BRUPA|nr:unnamed protein product [Brugia pahangi]